MIGAFFEESFYYLFAAGVCQLFAAIVVVPLLYGYSRWSGRRNFDRLMYVYSVFNGWLLLCGCVGHFTFHSLTFDKLYVSMDRWVDWLPFIPFNQGVLDRTFAGKQGGLIGDATFGQLRGIWLAVTVPVWAASILASRWVLRRRFVEVIVLSPTRSVG